MKKTIFLFLIVLFVFPSCSSKTEESQQEYETAPFIEKIKIKLHSFKLFRKSEKTISYTIKDIDQIFSDGVFDTAYGEYLTLAKEGNVEAQYKVGLMLANGQGISKNMEQAVKWWTTAAENGNKIAQYNLGVLYAKGQDVKEDFNMSADLFTLSAEQGFAKAQYALGLMYMQGVGVKKDIVEGVRLIKKAADNGDAQAIKELENLKS
jgi:TPR repeat protein